MELWATLFAGCGKAALAFPYAVNGVVHSGMGSYAHFHDAFLFWKLPFPIITGRDCCFCPAVPVCLSALLSVLSIGSGFLISGSEI